MNNEVSESTRRRVMASQAALSEAAHKQVEEEIADTLLNIEGLYRSVALRADIEAPGHASQALAIRIWWKQCRNGRMSWSELENNLHVAYMFCGEDTESEIQFLLNISRGNAEGLWSDYDWSEERNK